LPLAQTSYDKLTYDEAYDLVLAACEKLNKERGGDYLHPSGLPDDFITRVKEGFPRLQYWKQHQPVTWLTDEEVAFTEDMLDDDPDGRAEKTYLSILNDVPKWVEWEFGVVCRPMQAELLRSEASQIVVLDSRRIGKSWAVIFLACHYAYTHPQAEVLILVPSEKQLNEIFEIMRNKIFTLPTCRHFRPVAEGGIITVDRDKPSYEIAIEATHGASRIIGNICKGTIRGFGSENSLLIYDEFDFIEDKKAITAAMAIASQNPDIRILISSTPSGKRGQYYSFCTERAHGYELHQWSVWEGNVNWSVEMAIREVLRAIAEGLAGYEDYVHEYEADFGEEIGGWIPKALIDEAVSYPTFENGALGSDFFDNRGCIDPSSPIRIMGVDWDKMGEAGPSLLVLELDRRISKMRPIHVEEVPRGDKVYGVAVRRIIELNELLNPHYILCDPGSGERQIEELHEYGAAHPQSGLAYKVIRVPFNSSVEVHDYVTRDIVKKPMKQVMAAEMRRWFYERRVVLSTHRQNLTKQLLDYHVVKMTRMGLFEFTSKNEHFVDAFMLCVYGVSAYFESIFEKMVPPVIAATGKTAGDIVKQDTFNPLPIETKSAHQPNMAIVYLNGRPVADRRSTNWSAFSRSVDGWGR